MTTSGKADRTDQTSEPSRRQVITGLGLAAGALVNDSGPLFNEKAR